MVPVEVRKIIVESRAKGIPAEEIRKVTGVSLSAINNIVTNYKKRGTLEGNYPGRQPKITKEQRKAMIKLVKEKPDITINEIIEELNLPIKKSRVSKILLEEKMYLQQFHFRLTIATFRKPVLNIFSSYRRKSLEKKEIKHIRGASFPLA